jgi:hypothetical protein
VATAAAADAAGLVPAGPPGDLEGRVMAAVKASEARGDPLLVRAVELARVVAGEGATIPSPDLAGILVSNLCFAHNSPSLWKLVGQAMASRLLSPLHVLALLTPRYASRRRSVPVSNDLISLSGLALLFVGCCRSAEHSLRPIVSTLS